ncbi:Flp pilus assembly protein CpaB [Desulforamulus aquiferis]|uniref:SAF domain-containing protein n=1 Tax=Desulforamulus aquiferis TaxID=1397668 RepID=A0AAW7Z6Z2_9FIRM|nr:SAF domain-containing protein [Desulforamulus aquiferis]MDO7785798.1 hypothetical protein [Desulforamulus aquiferis]
MSTDKNKNKSSNKGVFLMLFFAMIFFGLFAYGIVKGNYLMLDAVPYVKATQKIPPYTMITEDMVMVDYIARKNARPGVIKDVKDVLGQITKCELPEGTPIYLGQLGIKGENTLTSQLTEMSGPYYRGKSLPVENLLGLDGDIRIGDRVDVNGSMKLPINGVQTPVSANIAQMVHVLGVIRDPNSNKMTGIKLAVSPQEGQDIDYVVGNGGKIGLMLCSYDAEKVETIPTTPEGFVNRHIPMEPGQENGEQQTFN